MMKFRQVSIPDSTIETIASNLRGKGKTPRQFTMKEVAPYVNEQLALVDPKFGPDHADNRQAYEFLYRLFRYFPDAFPNVTDEEGNRVRGTYQMVSTLKEAIANRPRRGRPRVVKFSDNVTVPVSVVEEALSTAGILDNVKAQAITVEETEEVEA